MNQAERPTGHEVCSSPEELASLFNQWKLSPEGQFAERKIATNLDLIEPFRDLAFGIHLAQQVFPNSEKYPYPTFKIDQSGRVASIVVQTTRTDGPIDFLAAKSWLQEHLRDNHPSTYLITTGVEEFSHWVFLAAIKQRRSKDYIASINNYYELTKENLERPLEEVSVKLKEIKEIGSLGLLKYIYLVLSGQIGQQIDKLTEIDKIEALLLESKSALLKHQSTFEEHMGIVWKNQVSQRYYPWAKEARDAKEQLEKVLAYKRQEAAEERIAALKQMS